MIDFILFLFIKSKFLNFFSKIFLSCSKYFSNILYTKERKEVQIHGKNDFETYKNLYIVRNKSKNIFAGPSE